MAATMRSARIGERDFTWGARTYVMGIVNVTPDSFSGDGVTDLETAVAQARQMEQDGADLIDIGGGSRRSRSPAGPRRGPGEGTAARRPGAPGGAGAGRGRAAHERSHARGRGRT